MNFVLCYHGSTVMHTQICERFYSDLPTVIKKISDMTCSDNSFAGMLALNHTREYNTLNAFMIMSKYKYY